MLLNSFSFFYPHLSVFAPKDIFTCFCTPPSLFYHLSCTNLPLSYFSSFPHQFLHFFVPTLLFFLTCFSLCFVNYCSSPVSALFLLPPLSVTASNSTARSTRHLSIWRKIKKAKHQWYCLKIIWKYSILEYFQSNLYLYMILHDALYSPLGWSPPLLLWGNPEPLKTTSIIKDWDQAWNLLLFLQWQDSQFLAPQVL